MKGGIISLAAALGLVACVQLRPFQCEESAECVIGEARGVCQDGYCAYFDGQCTTELRYEQNAGEGLGGLCVGAMEAIDCELYCDLYDDVCADIFPVYEAFSDCIEICGGWPGEDSSEGASLACRYGAVLDAQQSEEFAGCIDATPSGGDRCVDEGSAACAEYCEVYASRCGGVEGVDDEGGCLDACVALSPGVPGDPTGNTLACRMSVLDDEGVEDEFVCDRANLQGSPPCVD